MSLIQSAIHYKGLGLSIIPTDNTKKSLFPWKQYQSEIMSDQEIEEKFTHKKCHGIAVICGAVSNGLEVIDVDCKYGINFNEFANEIKRANPNLYSKLYIVKTKSEGYHIYYRCEQIEGNQKLANRPANDQELKANPNVKECVLIETRGEGGYVIAPPTEGYININKVSIPLISITERELIFDIAKSFNQVFELSKEAQSFDDSKFQKTPWDDYNDKANVIKLLNDHGWKSVDQKGDRVYFKRPGATSPTSANYHLGKKVFYVHTTSSQFANKGYSPFGVYAVLEHNGDFKAAAKKLSDTGYGDEKQKVEKKIIDKILKLKEFCTLQDDIKKCIISDYRLTEVEAKYYMEYVNSELAKRLETFWKVTYTIHNKKISISRYKFEKFLMESNFGLYFHNSKLNTYIFVRENDGYIEEVSMEIVKKHIKDYINSLPDAFDHDIGGTRYVTKEDLFDMLYKGSDSFFNSSFFEFFDKKTPNILMDTKNEAYFAFKNGVVVINKDEIKLINYSDIDKKIWKSQINFDRTITIDTEFDETLCEYFKFICKICAEDQDRVNYAQTLIGYNLHSYKDPAKPYASILAEETDDEAKGGGTGKGIFIKALSYLIPTVRIDGKNFRPDRSFAWQRVNLGDKLVVIEDCPRNVEFEKYYPTITEGMTIEKKNKDELFLNYSEAPKLAFTTNYSINSNAEHAKRRQKIFEFASYFNSKKTPIDEFGHKLFDDWEDEEWHRFYNFMFICVRVYLKYGVLEVDNSDKMRRKHIKLSFGEEFLEYFIAKKEDMTANWSSISEDWKGFMVKNEIDKKDYSLKRFRKALEISAAQFDLELEWTENRQSNNIKMFRFKMK